MRAVLSSVLSRKGPLWSDSVLFSLSNQEATWKEVSSPSAVPRDAKGGHRMSKVKSDTVYTVSRHSYRWHQGKGVKRGVSTTEERGPGVLQHREQLEGTSLGRVGGDCRCRTHKGLMAASKLDDLTKNGGEPSRDLRPTLS